MPITITCQADWAASTGYYRESTGWSVTSSFAKQRQTSTWIIVVNGDYAHFVDGQGNQGIYVVTKFDSTGVLLVRPGEADIAVQVISIDPSSSSFVYTAQDATLLWNRASTFVGSCN